MFHKQQIKNNIQTQNTKTDKVGLIHRVVIVLYTNLLSDVLAGTLYSIYREQSEKFFGRLMDLATKMSDLVSFRFTITTSCILWSIKRAICHECLL